MGISDYINKMKQNRREMETKRFNDRAEALRTLQAENQAREQKLKLVRAENQAKEQRKNQRRELIRAKTGLGNLKGSGKGNKLLSGLSNFGEKNSAFNMSSGNSAVWGANGSGSRDAFSLGNNRSLWTGETVKKKSDKKKKSRGKSITIRY